jgi:peptidoglycan glycosyltransferase
MYDFVDMVFPRCTTGLSFRFFSTVIAVSLSPSPVQAQEDEWPEPSRPMAVLDTTTLRDSHFVADLEGGGLAQLTLNPTLQRAVEETLGAYHLPFAAAAVVSIPDGRVLALAGSSEADPSLDAATLALRPWAPAASVFKVVAASALLQEAHVDPMTRVCYHGGVSTLRRDNLRDLPALDRRCGSLSYGIGKSQNAIIAKLAARHLRPEQLEHIATAFGFGQSLDFDAEMEPSEADIPSDPLEFARAAAGFWHSSLSVLHGALMAATIASRGEMPAARIIEKAVDPQGVAVDLPRRPSRRVLDPAVAEQVGRMMRLTTTMGTARRSFRDRKGHPYLPVAVAGKTGTLFYRGRPQDPALPSAAVSLEAGQLGYSWFVGFAPVDGPKIAFAVLLGKSTTRPLKAHHLARLLVAEYLASEGGARHGRLLAHR